MRERMGQNGSKKELLTQLGFDIRNLPFDESNDDFTD